MALQTSPGFAALTQLVKWMNKPLQYCVSRVNTLRISPEEALDKVRVCLAREASRRGRLTPTAQLHPLIPEALVISAWPGLKPLLDRPPDRPDYPVVIIDKTSGNAVLRGAPVFNGGVLAISENASIGDTVSVYVFHDGGRTWIAYGTLCSMPLTPDECRERPEPAGKVSNSCCVEITEGMSILPPLPDEMVRSGLLVHQSLPSMQATRVLNPQAGKRVLDLGAGTGYMTTHMAALTSNKAEIVAVDHSNPRLQTLNRRCELLGAKVTTVLAEAEDFAKKEASQFDYVLIEPNHSSFGVRPSIEELVYRGRGVNSNMRPIVKAAVDLLKPGGRLVFCTNTAMPIENEAVVRWLLDHCNVKLSAAEPRLAPVGVKPALPVASWMRLSNEEERLIQRFGAHTADFELDPINSDVPSYFIACFTKTA